VSGVVSRIKVMAHLDISERRVPQDGRVSLTIDGRRIDVRVVTLPLVGGESIVLRILDKGNVVMELDGLGFQPGEREHFERAIRRPDGAVLVTGPTGSGKSTTLYAALGAVNTREKTIITIEDPVEYELEGIKQVQVNAKGGLSFATGLRTMMRADPDLLMVGEIRDAETAHIAVDAALTGHLVFSTMHTKDTATALTRLVEMGIEPFLLASAIEVVVGQRLARTLCSSCRRETVIPASFLREGGYDAEEDLSAFEPGGCARCGRTGYRGRVGLFEVMRMTEEVRQLVLQRRAADEIAAVARSQGMRPLREDGLEKVRLGITSLAEVARVTS
jgi:type IV pilus assembly protein PilB